MPIDVQHIAQSGASVEVLQRALERERSRRTLAEQLLEDRSRDLFDASEALRQALADLQRNQKQMLQQEKLASLGVLSAGVAHEINNPLGYVLSNVSTLSDYVVTLLAGIDQMGSRVESASELSAAKGAVSTWIQSSDMRYVTEDAPSLLDETVEGLQRVRSIVEGLKTFAREDDGQSEAVDVNEAIRSSLTIARSQFRGRCEIDDLLVEVPAVLGNLSRLGQVFLNLIMNAGQAVDESGRVSVVSMVEGDWVIVRVEDDGCGISAENIARIFTPFFTTKPQGEGTGLGLSISHGIVVEHDGEISVSSEEGKGTCFTVRLPVLKGGKR